MNFGSGTVAASDIIIEINGKPTNNSAGGFLDTITDLNFGHNTVTFWWQSGYGLISAPFDAHAPPVPTLKLPAKTKIFKGKEYYSHIVGSTAAVTTTQTNYVYYWTSTTPLANGVAQYTHYTNTNGLDQWWISDSLFRPLYGPYPSLAVVQAQSPGFADRKSVV